MERQNTSRTRSADVMENTHFGELDILAWYFLQMLMFLVTDGWTWRAAAASWSSDDGCTWRTDGHVGPEGRKNIVHELSCEVFQGLGPERAVCCNLSVTGRLTVTRLLNTIFTSTILWLISHIYWRQADSVFHFSSVDMLWKCSRSRPFDWNDIMFYLLKKQNYLWSQSR